MSTRDGLVRDLGRIAGLAEGYEVHDFARAVDAIALDVMPWGKVADELARLRVAEWTGTAPPLLMGAMRLDELLERAERMARVLEAADQ